MKFKGNLHYNITIIFTITIKSSLNNNYIIPGFDDVQYFHRFPITSFIFLFNIMDITIEAIESITAVRNIKSNENDEGNDSVIPLTLIID